MGITDDISDTLTIYGAYKRYIWLELLSNWQVCPALISCSLTQFSIILNIWLINVLIWNVLDMQRKTKIQL